MSKLFILSESPSGMLSTVHAIREAMKAAGEEGSVVEARKTYGMMRTHGAGFVCEVADEDKARVAALLAGVGCESIFDPSPAFLDQCHPGNAEPPADESEDPDDEFDYDPSASAVVLMGFTGGDPLKAAAFAYQLHRADSSPYWHDVQAVLCDLYPWIAEPIVSNGLGVAE